jgi:hypothetical protein
MEKLIHLILQAEDYEYSKSKALLQLSCFCSAYMLITNVGQYQNYYNVAQQQKDELEGLSRVLS